MVYKNYLLDSNICGIAVKFFHVSLFFFYLFPILFENSLKRAQNLGST